MNRCSHTCPVFCTIERGACGIRLWLPAHTRVCSLPATEATMIRIRRSCLCGQTCATAPEPAARLLAHPDRRCFRRMMEAFIFMRKYPNDSSCPEISPTGLSGERAETANGSPSVTEQAAFEAMRKSANGPKRQTDSAGLAAPYADAEADAEGSGAFIGVSRRADQDITADSFAALFFVRAGLHTIYRGVRSSSGKGREQ